MPRIVWDAPGERRYHHGVDRGVLYVKGSDGDYGVGVPWNGLVSVTSSPTGAEATPFYANNKKYLNLMSAEEFAGSIEAFTYPDKFVECEGEVAHSTAPSLSFTGQPRKEFGLTWREKVSTDANEDAGHIIHIAYNCLASVSEKVATTINETPEPQTMSWDFTTTPESFEAVGFRPTAHFKINTVGMAAGLLADLEDGLYGDADGEAGLPTPDQLILLLTAAG